MNKVREKKEEFRRRFASSICLGTVRQEDVDNWLSHALQEMADTARVEVIADLSVMLELAEEIIDEARLHYEYDDNEMYTIVDFQINAQRLRKHYKKEFDQLKSQQEPESCTVPPEGWHCTRKAGHDGPCAAVPIDDQLKAHTGQEEGKG